MADVELLAIVHGKVRGINLGNWSTKAFAYPNSPMELRRIGVLVHEMATMVIGYGLWVRQIPTKELSLLVGPIYGSQCSSGDW